MSTERIDEIEARLAAATGDYWFASCTDGAWSVKANTLAFTGDPDRVVASGLTETDARFIAGARTADITHLLAEVQRLRGRIDAARELLSADADAYPDEITGWDICAKAYALLGEPDGGAS